MKLLKFNGKRRKCAKQKSGQEKQNRRRNKRTTHKGKPISDIRHEYRREKLKRKHRSSARRDNSVKETRRRPLVGKSAARVIPNAQSGQYYGNNARCRKNRIAIVGRKHSQRHEFNNQYACSGQKNHTKKDIVLKDTHGAEGGTRTHKPCGASS